LNETFNRIISLGMFEHVGVKNYETYMQVIKRCLKPDGLCLLQTIGTNKPDGGADPWIVRYIFPNSMLPSMQQIIQASQQTLVVEDWHNFGADYDLTLMSWYRNFEAAWDELQHTYDERFYRMWRFYLLGSAAGFRSRHNQLWQIVFSPYGIPGGCRVPR
jgi:cyclopropane-fatty-acyl-phospholipid synthase